MGSVRGFKPRGKPFAKGVSGNPAGKPKGTPNRVTRDVAQLARNILENAEVQARLLADAQRGQLPPPVLVTMMHYAYGKPKDTVKVEGIEALNVVISDHVGPRAGDDSASS